MNIKSLELIGFKSFYNKSSIEFHKGINAIVGPNGCGKSNLIDAIRWILGEQNSRLLRAEGSMEELISNGSEKLNPLGMAEATMVIENVPGSGFEEMSIKRRLYRSGESEYYINGVRCRLKDIREMFMDTGVGSRAYSIIGQGKVEEFITAKPEDKRKLIEEVAGIVKYKTRRKETQSRLESTRENLSRIQDMKREVSRQMNNLSRQAENADKYKNLSGEATRLELKILNSKEAELQNRISEISEQTAGLHEKISELTSRRKEKSSTLEQRETDNSLLDEKISGIEDEIFRLKSEQNNKTSFLSYADKEVSNIELYKERLQQEIESLENEREEIKDSISNKKSELENLNKDVSALGSRINEKSDQLSGIKNNSSGKRSDLQQTREQLFKTINEHSNLKESLYGIRKEIEEMYLRKERVNKEKTDLEDEIQNAEGQSNSYTEEINRLRSEKAGLEKELQEKKGILSDTKTDYDEYLEKIAEAKEDHSRKSSRIHALEQIQSNYEWLPETTRNFLLESKGNGILGVITDYISAPKNYEKALEAALAEKLNWVVVKESSEAVRAVENLRQSSMGRSTFIPVNNDYTHGRFEKNGTNVSMINEIVNVDGIEKEMVDALLNGIFVVSDLNEAFELKKQLGNGASFVTPDGDYLDSSGAISGGYTSGGVFERKTEISELQETIKENEENISSLNTYAENLNREIQNTENLIAQVEEKIRSVDIKLIELNKDLSNLNLTLQKYRDRIRTIDNEIESINDEVAEKEQSVDQLKSRTTELETEKNRLNAEFSQYEKVIGELEERENEIEEEVGSLRIENASMIEKKKAIEYEISELDNRLERIGEKIGDKYEEIESKNTEKQNLYISIEQNRSEIEQVTESIKHNQKILDDSKSQKQNERDELKRSRQEVEELDNRIDELREKNSQLEVKLNSAQIEQQHVAEKKENIREEENDVSEENSEEPDFNLQDAEQRLSDLKKKIEKFGPVNLLAPEEYKSLEERFNFLEEQTQDLENAIESLKKAMNKLDRESVTRFREAFDVINTKFQETLSRLFPGGEGKLVVIDPEDILQTGIEVMVKPKGKKYQSINLLSGGEKALSAIALIISACFVKPVPFLILDEIDAPLDEANTVKFTELIREIANDSQVIVITHNKVTMQTVDSLIGVTSDRSVTSKIVSVDMQAHN